MPAGACKAQEKRAQNAGKYQRQAYRQRCAGVIKMAYLIKDLAVCVSAVPRKKFVMKSAGANAMVLNVKVCA